MIRLENVHRMAKDRDAARLLIDRKWPRGVTRFIPHKEESGGSRRALAPILWRPRLAPGALLSQWFYLNQDTDQFRRKYFRELRGKEEEWKPLLRRAKKESVSLLYHDDGLSLVAAKAFKEFLEAEMKDRAVPDGARSRREAPAGRGVVVPPVEKAISRKLKLPQKKETVRQAYEKRVFVSPEKRKRF